MVKNNQSGFAPVLILLVVVVLGVVGFGVWRVTDSNKPQLNNQTEAPQAAQLSPQDKVTLAEAKELKKIDFDLDGQVNSVDQDDDNDGQNDNVDQDDDNDGQNDNVDQDDDNDGVNDDKDNEAAQQSEVQEKNSGTDQEGSSSNSDDNTTEN